jgi:hypothetical protein
MENSGASKHIRTDFFTTVQIMNVWWSKSLLYSIGVIWEGEGQGYANAPPNNFST